MSHIKKSLIHPKADEEKRRIFQEKVRTYEANGKPIVYIDESGFAHDEPRTHGVAPRGERCFGHKDWNARGRTNAIGALLGASLLTVSLFQGNINSDVFHAWLIQDLIPKLPQGAVIVMDNAPFHKRQDIQKVITDAKHILEYLPPYSPDLNPIEHKWAKAKAKRRKTAKSVEQIFKQQL